MSRRLDMKSNGDLNEDEAIQYVSLFLPELGNVSITHEDAPDWDEAPKLVIHVDFDVSKIRIIDGGGNDVKIT